MQRSTAFHLRRSFPYIHSLANSRLTENEKVALLKRFPDFVLKDVVEILYNIVNKTVQPSPKFMSPIKRKERSIVKFLDDAKKYKQSPKLALRKQKGHFLGFVIPAILSVLSSLA